MSGRLRPSASHLRVASALLLAAWMTPAGRAAEPVATAPSQDCVEVEVGQEHVTSLGCLNQQFEKAVQQAQHAQLITAPIDAQSPSNVVGTANRAAAEQMMGNAFGKSATPQRPKLVYGIPLLQNFRQ